MVYFLWCYRWIKRWLFWLCCWCLSKQFAWITFREFKKPAECCQLYQRLHPFWCWQFKIRIHCFRVSLFSTFWMDDLLAFFDIIITFLVDLQHMIIININTTIVTAYIQFLCSNTSFSKLFSSAWLSCEVVVLIIIGVLCVVFNFWWQLIFNNQVYDKFIF